MSLILVVEDDRIQRQVTAQALKSTGHEVLEALDGAEGLQSARTYKPDLIVCDVMMPGMNGYQLVTALREEESIADIPVIMLTAMTERAHMRTAMTSGADDYIAKPFSFQELNEAASALIAKRKAQHEGFVNSRKSEIAEALDEQKQVLSGQYERRFVQELNSRWERGAKGDAELKYEEATLLVVDLLGSALQQLPSGTDAGNIVRHAYQAARDTLYLFRAQHLLAYGNDVLAIFADPPASVGVSPKMRAMRAACALVKARANVPKTAQPGVPGAAASGDIAIAMHEGPITLLRVCDPLHGDPDATLATGEALNAAKSLREYAQASNWRIACSAAMLVGMEGQLRTGRTAAVSLGPLRRALDAVELLGVS
jgi:DNA-binding response OmpR family regulator